MSQLDGSAENIPVEEKLAPHDHSQKFYDFAKYAFERFPLHPKVTIGERRRLCHNHILDVGEIALAIATRQSRTAKFGVGSAENLLARVILPDHRVDAAVDLPDMDECWLDSPILLVDVGPCTVKRFTSEVFVGHDEPNSRNLHQLVTYNIDLSQAVVIDGYRRLRHACRLARDNGKPELIRYISISMWEALRYVPTIAIGQRRRQTVEQIRSLFVKDEANPPADTLHRYLPAARANALHGPGMRRDKSNFEKLVIGTINAPISRGRPKADAVIASLFLHWRLEFRRASVYRDLLSKERHRLGKLAWPAEITLPAKLTPGDLYDLITDPVVVPIAEENLKYSRLVSKRELRDRSKIDRRQYREKIGVMSLDAFLDQITSKTYEEGGFRDREEFEEKCQIDFKNATDKDGIAGGVDLLLKAISHAIILFKIYFRIKCLCYPAAREILALKQSEEAFASMSSKAREDYEHAFADLMTGVVGSVTEIHVKDLFIYSAKTGCNLCDFYPRCSVVSDIVDVLVDVLAQAKDKSGKASKTRRARACAVTFACYGVSHYVYKADRWKAWSDFSEQAEANGVSFDDAVDIYMKIYHEIAPPDRTRNGFSLPEDKLMGPILVSISP